MKTIKRGSRGHDVRHLQMSLKTLGYDPGDVDGIFGAGTEGAVLDFQHDYEELTIDGIVGPKTWAWIEQALVSHDRDEDDGEPEVFSSDPVASELICPGEVWDGFQEIVKTITAHPVRYGPGRGLFVDGEFVVTLGPGRLNHDKWKSKLGRTYPSFHCSSWTNFFLGWLSRRNEKYTHSGNVPSLFKLCEASPELHPQEGIKPWRGYNDICKKLLSDGSSAPRTRQRHRAVIDLQELYDRRHTLPTFFICGQSTRRRGGGIKWWHHTVLFVIDHRQPGSPLYRIAADGYKGGSGYSGTPMKYKHMDEYSVRSDVGVHLYRGYTLHPTLGPLADVVIEQ